MTSPNTTIQRRELGEIASEYALVESQRKFIGLKLMPIFNTALQSGNYTNIPIEEMLKPRKTKRAPRGAYNRGNWEFEQPSYATQEYGWEEVVDDSDARNYRSYFDAEQLSTRLATDVILRDQEERIADVVEGLTANNVSVKWSEAATATPRADVQAGIKSIMNATGEMPDTLQITWQTFQYLLITDEVTNNVKYTNPITMMGFEAQKQALATYLGVSKIEVGNAIKNGADEGATFSASQLWTDSRGCLLVTAQGDFDTKPAFGRSMLWTGDSPTNVVIETYREEQVRGEIVRARQNLDELVLNTTAAYSFGNLA